MKWKCQEDHLPMTVSLDSNQQHKEWKLKSHWQAQQEFNWSEQPEKVCETNNQCQLIMVKQLDIQITNLPKNFKLNE